MPPTHTDGPLALARHRLEDAVAALADPAPVRVGDLCRWSDSVYSRLRGSLRGSKTTRRNVMRGPSPPCRTDVLALLVEIDTTVAGWEPHGKTTPERLHQLAGRGWRPQDCGLIEDYCDRLQRWASAAAELLGPEPRVYLRETCPRCGARFAYRDNAGERVRAPALRVSESGCRRGPGSCLINYRPAALMMLWSRFKTL